jgi:hypothetical protein
MSVSKNNIIICPPTRDSIRKILKLIGKNNFKWAYFSENVLGAITLQRWIGNTGEQIDIAERLQEAARALRQPYIDYIGKLSVRYNSMQWWATSLSEKSSFTHSIFLHSCYITVALSLLKSFRQENLIFFVENRALRSCLVENMSEMFGCNVICLEPKFSNILEFLTNSTEFILKHGWFILNNIYRIILTKHIYHLDKIDVFHEKNNSKNDFILIHTWVDQRCFTEGDYFQDSYFGTLARYITKKGENVVIVPSIYYTAPYMETVKKLMNCKENFLISSAHLKIADILAVSKSTLKKPVKKNCPLFEKMNISDLIFSNRINDWKNTRLDSSLLLYYLVKNWKNQVLPIERFIYTHENHTWEKMYCMAFREFFPEVNLVGYQHSTICKMDLCHSVSKYDREVVPFPDVVITNGKYFKRFLLNSGYDSQKLISGGALRYEYVIDLIMQPTLPIKNDEITGKKFKILVATSAYKNESIELLQYVLDIFGSFDLYEIILKFHPVMPYKEIADAMGIKTPLPKHFFIASQPVNVLLKECDVLLYKTTTICVEALATGVYPIHIKSSYSIDCDILDGIPEDMHSSLKTEEEILYKLKKLQEMTGEESHKRELAAKIIVEEFFGTVNDSVYELFITKVNKNHSTNKL